MKKTVVVLVPVLLLGGAIAWWWSQRTPSAPSGLSGSGVVEATEADLGFQLPGHIATIEPREGDAVELGDELAALDRSELVARRDAALGRLTTARSRLSELRRGARPEEIAQAEARMRTARERVADAARDLARARTLRDGGAISQEALDKSETAQQVAAAALDEATQALALIRQGPRDEVIAAQQGVVRQAEATVAQADAQLAHATVVAPFGGLVTVRHREPGETVGAGQPVLRIRDLDDRWVRIYVPGDAIGRVHVGQQASIRSDTYPDRTFGGSVFFIGSEAEFTPRNVQTTEERTRLVYAVKVRITDDPDYVLKPGVPADVRLHEAESR